MLNPENIPEDTKVQFKNLTYQELATPGERKGKEGMLNDIEVLEVRRMTPDSLTNLAQVLAA